MVVIRVTAGVFRARVGLEGQVNDTVKAKIRLASGGDDPVSTNQSFDGAFSSKGFQLDRAYVIWTPETLGGAALSMGKMANPFRKLKDLVWDGDLNPEGVALSHSLGDDGMKLGLDAGAFWLEERSKDDDTMMYGAQLTASSKTDGGNQDPRWR